MQMTTTAMKPTNLIEYKEKAKQWACDRLSDANTVILDLESTGLLREDPETEIAQICITDVKGRQLFSMLLKPCTPMSDRVIDIHKITNEQIFHQPMFPQVARMISFVLKGKHVIAWNMEFDWVLLTHMFQKYDIAKPEVAGLSCAMDKYSEWAGEWNNKRESFKWQRLPNFAGTDAHDAFYDCQNTLLAMRKMAGLFNEEELTASDIDLDF